MTSPRITLAVLAYNQANLIEGAIDSAFSQICEPVEILLSDDASTDATFEKMQALANTYQGRHKITLRRNATNLGIAEHYNQIVRSALGTLIVTMAGDDISLPTRVARIAQVWDASQQQLDLIASHLIDMTYAGVDQGIISIDDLSQWKSVKDWAQRNPYVVGASHAFTRRMMERFGPLERDLVSEDLVMVFRAICSGGACTIPEPLVKYRRGGTTDKDQNRNFSSHDFIASVRRKNGRHIALQRQWRHDAKVAGCEAIVEQVTGKEFQRLLFLDALLSAPDIASRWQVTRRASSVKASWRWRKFIYFGLPKLAAQVKRWQSGWKQLRHRNKH